MLLYGDKGLKFAENLNRVKMNVMAMLLYGDKGLKFAKNLNRVIT